MRKSVTLTHSCINACSVLFAVAVLAAYVAKVLSGETTVLLVCSVYFAMRILG